MSLSYSHQSGSNFPDSVLSLSNFKDMDDTIKDIVTQYYNFVSAGNINSAQALIEANAATLKQYWIDSSEINKLEEELYNIGLFTQKKRAVVVFSTEPTVEYEENTLWYKPVEG